MCVHLPMFIYCICTHVNLSPACEGLCVCECACSVCASSHTSDSHNNIVKFALPAWRELWLKYTPLPPISNLLFFSPQSMPFSSLHPLPCSLSAGGEIQMWRETGTGKAKGAREGEGDRNPHPPVTDFIVQDLLDKAFTDTYTQTIMHTKQWSPSRRQGPIVHLCIFPPYVCVFVCAHLMTKQSMNNILLEICCRYLAELFTGGGLGQAWSYCSRLVGREEEINTDLRERSKQWVTAVCQHPPLCFAPSIFVKFSHLHHQVGPGADDYI